MELDDVFDFCDGIQSIAAADNLNSSADVMIDRYFQDPRRTSEMLRRSPPMEKIFRRYNVSRPSNAAVERLFSYAMMTDAPKSNRLGDETSEQRIVLRSWLTSSGS